MSYSLLEAYKELKEDITSIKRLRDMYSKIDNETFTNLLKLDPTYNDSDTQSGIYANWILNKYNKGIIKNDDFENVTKALEFFNKHKNRFKNRDLNTYKTLQELEDAIEEVEAADPTKSQLKRMVQRTDLDKDAPLFMQTKNFDIYIPLTYEASCKLGTNTEWCTATRSDRRYYDNYTRDDNKLYVMINRKNPQIKYQWNTLDDYTCDQDDTQLELLTILCTYPDLLDFYRKVGSKDVTNDMEERIQEHKLLRDKLLSNYLHNGVFECNSECLDLLSKGSFDVGDKKIEKVIIKSDIRRLPKKSFYGWTNLKEVEFEEGQLYAIEERAFCNTSIQSIELPKSLRYMGNHVFDGCDKLGLILLHSVVENDGENEAEEPEDYSSRYIIMNGRLEEAYREYILDNCSDDYDNYFEEDEYGEMYVNDEGLEYYLFLLFGTSCYISSWTGYFSREARDDYKIDENKLQQIKYSIAWFTRLKQLADLTIGESENLIIKRGSEHSFNYIPIKLVPAGQDPRERHYRYNVSLDNEGKIHFDYPNYWYTASNSIDKLEKFDKEHHNILHLFRLHALECIEALRERNAIGDNIKIQKITNLLKDFNY